MNIRKTIQKPKVAKKQTLPGGVSGSYRTMLLLREDANLEENLTKFFNGNQNLLEKLMRYLVKYH